MRQKASNKIMCRRTILARGGNRIVMKIRDRSGRIATLGVICAILAGAWSLAAGQQEEIVKDVSTIRAYTFDPSDGEEGAISYNLLQPARLRIIISAKGDQDQLYRVLLWDWQEPGNHEVVWDGMDQSGYPVVPKECSIWMRFDPKSTYRPKTKVIQPLTTAELVMGKQGLHDHNTCDPDKCKLSKPLIKEPRDGAIVSGTITIKVEVDKNARGYADQSGYGARWMVDQQLIAGMYYEKESDGKFEFRLDTTSFPNGPHVIRVGTCDHYDHVGATSIQLIFEN